MTEVTSWFQDLTASAVKACKATAESISAHADAAQRQYVLAAIDAEKIYRHYLKGDEARLVAYFEAEVRGIKASMAMVYVRAGRTYRLRDTLGLTKAQCDAMSVHALAQLQAYASSSDEEKVAEGVAILAADAAATVAAEAEGKTRKPLTKEGLLEVKQALKAEADGTEPVDKVGKRIGRIESKLRDEVRSAFHSMRAIAADTSDAGGDVAAFLYALRLGAEWGAAHGASTPLAIDGLAAEWEKDREKQARVVAAAKRKADREAKQAEEAAAKLTAAIDQVRPPVKVTPTEAKRTERKPEVASLAPKGRATRKPRGK